MENINILTTMMTLVLGVVGTYITQFVKNYLKWEGRKASVLNLVISFVLALGVVFFGGSFNAENIVATVGAIFTLTTLSYNFLVKQV